MKIFILILVLLLPLSMLKAEDGVKKKTDIIAEARKKHPQKPDIFIKKGADVIGLKKLSESQLIPGLDHFLDELRKIVSNHDISALEKKIALDFYCGDFEGPHKQDFKHCAKYLELEKGESWDQILHTLNSGGCIRLSGFYMPGLLECVLTEAGEDPIPPKYYIKDAEMKIYEKIDINSKFQILPANYFYTEVKGFPSDRTTCSAQPCERWSLISTKSGLSGYIPYSTFWPSQDRYRYHMTIEHDGSKFIIRYLGLR